MSLIERFPTPATGYPLLFEAPALAHYHHPRRATAALSEAAETPSAEPAPWVSNLTDTALAGLIRKYQPQPMPPCSQCGGERRLLDTDRSGLRTWVCATAADALSGPKHRLESTVEHFNASLHYISREPDPEVVAALSELQRWRDENLAELGGSGEAEANAEP